MKYNRDKVFAALSESHSVSDFAILMEEGIRVEKKGEDGIAFLYQKGGMVFATIEFFGPLGLKFSSSLLSGLPEQDAFLEVCGIIRELLKK